jgi:hypothetical protein
MAKKAARKAAAMKRVSAKKASGVALHIGLNEVDPTHYGGWNGPLNACEQDARDMADIAKRNGMKATTLLTKKATRARALAGIRAAAKKLKRGDFFLLSYSGHGGQVHDITGDEPDKKDETWCLFDGELIDDELYFALSKFAGGVRILVLSDSCHSGTVTRARPEPPPPGTRSKMMPPDIADQTYQMNQSFYDGLQRAVAKAAKSGGLPDPDTMLAQVATNPRIAGIVKKFKAGVILVSGCQDNQTSLDGAHNGAFTEQLLKVWSGGAFKGNYVRFHADITAGLPSSQTPNLFTLGAAGTFLKQKPFTV